MRFKKVYGEYKTDTCPFCEKQALFTNKAGIAVCKDHVQTEQPPLKCMCGAYVDIIKGKYGNYAQCLRCGNIPLKKILAYNNL